MATHDQFNEALRKARMAEAAHLDALHNVRDARGLRLAALRENILPHIKGHPLAEGFSELSLQQGDMPRLWIDLISSVVVEPDTRTYRLVQDTDGNRVILNETHNPEEMSKAVLRYIAHRVIAREKAAAGEPPRPRDSRSEYRLGELVYVWFTGAALGVLSMLIVAILLGLITF